MRILGKEERWEPALECVSGRVETPRRARGSGDGAAWNGQERGRAAAGCRQASYSRLAAEGPAALRQALTKRQPRSLQLYKETERLKSPDKLFIFLRCGFS